MGHPPYIMDKILITGMGTVTLINLNDIFGKEIMKRFKIFTVIIILIFIGGCGKKEPPTIGISYCYLYGDDAKVVYPDGSSYSCRIEYQDDFNCDNGCIYFAGVDNVFKANVSQNDLIPLVDVNEYKRITDNYDGVNPVVSLRDSEKVAVQAYNRDNDHSDIYFIENGKMEFLCEVDGRGINNNSHGNMNRVAFCADKSGENLFVKQNDQLVKFNIRSKQGTTLISDFKYDIFDVDGSGDKVAYIYRDSIYLYEVSSGNETLIGEMGFPLGKICISDDGNWIMVIDVTAVNGIWPNPYPGRRNNLYIYDCVNKTKYLVVEDCGSDRGAFDFAE